MQEHQTLLSPPTQVVPSPVQINLGQALIKAIDHHHAGRTMEAERLYRSVLPTSPDRAIASYNLGVLCSAQGRLPEAIDAYRHAIAMKPEYIDAYINLGAATLALGQHQEALTLYQQAIAICPDCAMALGNLGKTLQDLGRIDEAIATYHEALAHQPNNAAINTNLGAALIERRAWAESAIATRRAIVLQPDNAMAHTNLGTALLNLDCHEEALVVCRLAMTLQPLSCAIQATLGGIMMELGALDEAETLCRNAIALDPTSPNSYFNLSHAYKAMNQLPGAVEAVRQAIVLCPDSAVYHFHLAHLLLLQGDLESGWEEYDWRWKLPDFAWLDAIHGVFPQPRWTGEDIADKTILVYTEQGLGDVIQFARYLPLLVHRAKRVIVAVHEPLRRLLARIAGITIVAIHESLLPAFDVHCPLLSLPRAFATGLDTIPATVPYLHAAPHEQARWDKRIGGNKPRIGIVWAGNPVTKRDRFRSPGLASVEPLFSLPGIDFIVLQVGPGRNDCDVSRWPPHVLDLGAEITDLADTAAIMSSLDLMISSCTGPLHLAGALGIPTWAMIPFAPYFPWLLERSDSLWYPNMRLYRQEKPGQDWSGVVDAITIDLAGWTQSNMSLPQRPMAAAPAHRSDSLNTEGFNELAYCRSGPMIFNRNDIYIGASLRKYGEFSSGETSLFDIIVQPGMTVLDIGANIGVHTVDLSRLVGPTGLVYSFEPQRLLFQVLCGNVALNSCANVFTHCAAAGAVSDTLLAPRLDPNGRGNYGGLSLSDTQQGEPVPLITIDGLSLSACHIIKLDVEGMETEALQGAVATIRRFRPILYVENDRQARSAELIGLIQSYDYRLYWHLPPLYNPANYRSDTENIFGNTVSVNMICIPIEIPQSALTGLSEVTFPTDVW